MGDGAGEGVGDREGDGLGTPVVAAGRGVGEVVGLGLGLGSSTTSQWGPVVPVPVQSHAGPVLPTAQTPGPHTMEEQAVTCTA